MTYQRVSVSGVDSQQHLTKRLSLQHCGCVAWGLEDGGVEVASNGQATHLGHEHGFSTGGRNSKYKQNVIIKSLYNLRTVFEKKIARSNKT